MSELIDNRAHRIRTLKQIIKKLHSGTPEEDVRDQLAMLVRQVDSSEVAAMEQELIREGMPVAEVQSMCDLHSKVMQDLIVERVKSDTPPGHPVETFRSENEAIAGRIASLRELLDKFEREPSADRLNEISGIFNELNDVDKHYRRKENLLFPILERYDITGPTQVMWGKDDEARGLLKEFGRALKDGSEKTAEVISAGRAALDSIAEMINKEEKILLPMCLEALTEGDWAEIWRQSPEIGWCIVDPGQEYLPPAPERPEKVADISESDAIVFPTGNLDFKQLRGIFSTLPVDVTFVDADDTVRFFSEGRHVFDRPKSIIGRKVHHCHPPSSVDVVEKILQDFRSGVQDKAEFWIQLHGMFVHIRYFAVRDEKGEYLGTLEVTQDLSELRKLEGERRLLEYDN